MLNEFTYCPRLFYYEHVDGIFVHNQETVEGAIVHRRVDSKEDEFPPPEELAESPGTTRSRSIMLASDRYGVVAKMDLIESDGERVTPVDYKRGRPRESADGLPEAWDPERVQMAVQALILRDHGYHCDEGIVYYAATKQRVRIVIDEPLVEQTLKMIAQARELTRQAQIPPPLVDSPKCPRCSLVGICLPDETNRCSRDGRDAGTLVQRTLFDVGEPRRATLASETASNGDARRLLAARDDLRPLYLNTQGYSVGKSGQVLKVKNRSDVVQEVRLNEICQLNLFGNVQLSTQAIQALCEADIPIAYFSQGG